MCVVINTWILKNLLLLSIKKGNSIAVDLFVRQRERATKGREYAYGVNRCIIVFYFSRTLHRARNTFIINQLPWRVLLFLSVSLLLLIWHNHLFLLIRRRDFFMGGRLLVKRRRHISKSRRRFNKSRTPSQSSQSEQLENWQSCQHLR